MLEERRQKTKELSAMTKLSKTTVLKILRVKGCTQFLSFCKADENKFLDSIVTGNETMILYHNPLSKRESM